MKRTPWHVVSFVALAIASLAACSQSSPVPEPRETSVAPVVVRPDAPPEAVLEEPAPAPKPDPRTPDEIAQAACRSPDGGWHCAKLKAKPQVRALSAGPVIPTSWTVPTWFVDPGNVSGAASDSNSCTTSGAPCVTWHQISDIRWGCQGTATKCPRLRQNTTITFLSSQTDDSDPVYFRPAIENVALVTVQGSLTTVATLTGGLSIVGKNRGTGQLLNATLGGSGAPNQILINSTHASHATAYKSLGAGVFSITQPAVYPTFPNSVAQNEVDTWASGDTVTLNTVPNVNIVDLQPTVSSGGTGSGTTVGQLYLNQLEVFDPASGDGVDLNMQVRGFDVVFQRQPNWHVGTNAFASSAGCLNCTFLNGLVKGEISSNGLKLLGGSVQFGQFANVQFDNDVIIASSVVTTAGVVSVTCAYLDTNGAILPIGGPMDASVTSANCTGSPVLWGIGASSGAINAQQNQHVKYKSGAGGAAATFLQSGALRANSQTLACIGVPSVASPTLTCNVTISATTLDADLGATSGCLFVEGGGSYCNF